MPAVNMVFIYYDNPLMLKRQIECWNSYVGALKEIPRVILVDDGSPRTSAAGIIRETGCALPVEVYRIKEDITWNFAGARNLGCTMAEGWVYVSDMDTLLLSDDARGFFESAPLDPDCFYMPERVNFETLEVMAPGIVNLLFRKEKYVAIGGYDEDYAGFYGKEETDFLTRMKRVARHIKRHDVMIRVVRNRLIRDASTHGKVRDKTRNAEVFGRKQAAGFVNPVNPLRFSWERHL